MTERPDVDAVVVGGGHNGLVCAAFLARAGLNVTLLEANPTCGGALFSTEAHGVVLEHGGVEHTTMLSTGIVEALELADHGLRYHERTIAGVHRFGDGVELVMGPTLDATAASVRDVSGPDGDAWLELADRFARMFELLAIVSEGRPPTMALLRRLTPLLSARDRDVMALATMPVADLAIERFRSPHVRALAIARTGFSGLPAWEPGTGSVFGLTVAGHGRSLGRPIGGSAAFVDALIRAAEDAGAVIETGEPVDHVLATSAGWRVRTESGRELSARAVVAALPPHLTVQLVRPTEAVPLRLRRGLSDADATKANLSQFTLSIAIDGLPAGLRTMTPETAASMLWLMTDPKDALAAQSAAVVGRLPRRPPILMSPVSLIDPTLSRSGAHSLWVNGFLARTLDDGRPWTRTDTDLATERVWSVIEACLGPVDGEVLDQVFTSPTDLTARTGAVNPGGHLAPTLDRIMGGRPARGFADHRAGPGLYLTGAGTGAGPGISGLPGRSCAEAVLHDLTTGRERVARLAANATIEARRAARLLRTRIRG